MPGNPAGGGAYVVAGDNVGPIAGLVAAAALLVDYELTVAVSLAAGVLAISSAASGLHANGLELALLVLAIIVLANLRGVREAGALFAPTRAVTHANPRDYNTGIRRCEHTEDEVATIRNVIESRAN